MNLFLIEMPGGGEMIIILVVVLLLFGGKKIPELMRGLGRGVREFNDAKGNITKELEEGMKEKDEVVTPKSAVNTTATGFAAEPLHNGTSHSSNPTTTG
jgi:sec-independent protein translocase protein TatA